MRQGKSPEGTGDRREPDHHHHPGQGSRRERKRRDERMNGGITTENRTVPPPPGTEDRRNDRRKREEGKAGADQNRTDQDKGKNEDTTREYRKRTEGKPENSMVCISADFLTLSFFIYNRNLKISEYAHPRIPLWMAGCSLVLLMAGCPSLSVAGCPLTQGLHGYIIGMFV